MEKLRLYLSSAPDLRFERSVLARAVAEIPTSLGWLIRQTPNEAREPDLGAIRRADAFILLLGRDIQAPVGLEWSTAQRAGARILAFYSTATRQTQAAQAFISEVERFTRWQKFASAAELRYKVLRLLVDHLVAHREEYEIDAAEVQRLRAWREQLKQTPVDDVRAQTHANAVIFTTERYEPSEGVLINAPPAEGANS
ncbi:MAG: hypothetical protein NZL91_08455 [Thermoflexales bacterium]|nr:hypothetical protein [Thermoflexales bacterium]MCS7325213.1 hypothetical protein [Thermoflexales bacterium]MCX7939987.1 hypothetical protein [Thermoflexales bacterium]MDW8053361.1 hypothetical protein [Anaerolineae bacterium]MDW8292014.1 hypothetical protein [Anaerolineae bacterium]